MRDEHMRPACWKGSTVLAQMSRSMRPADIVRCHRFGDGSKSIITIFGGNRHPLTSYYRVPMGTRVWPPFEHQLCCNLEGCPHVERDWRRDQYPGGRCGCLCCKVATIGGMACNHMQTVLVCVCMPVRAHAGFLMTGRLCWRTLSGFLSGKETSLFPAVSSHSVLNPASMCMLPQHLDPLAEIYWDTWSNKYIYIICNASEASWQTWEFPWRASMRVKAWLFTCTFFSRCCRKCHLSSPVLSRGDAIFTSAVEYFTPEGFFIASEAVGLLGSMKIMKFNGWQWIFVEFSLLS